MTIHCIIIKKYLGEQQQAAVVEPFFHHHQQLSLSALTDYTTSQKLSECDCDSARIINIMVIEIVETSAFTWASKSSWTISIQHPAIMMIYNREFHFMVWTKLMKVMELELCVFCGGDQDETKNKFVVMCVS